MSLEKVRNKEEVGVWMDAQITSFHTLPHLAMSFLMAKRREVE